jgi:hypothetical protein
MAQAQSNSRYTKIVNTGAIISTPDFCNNEGYMKNLTAVTDPEFAKQLCIYTEEKNWPSALETFEKRNNGGRDLLKQCNTYYVTDLGKDLVLLWISKEKNQHLPAEMLDKSDFLVVIGKEAVELGDKVSLYGDNKTVEPQTVSEPVVSAPKPVINLNSIGFHDQLVNIVADYQNQFKTLTGDLIPEEEGSISFTRQYKSKILLTGAVNSYIAEDKMNYKVSFIADYGDFSDKNVAIAKYHQVVALINRTEFPSFSIVKIDESVNESITSQAFLPFDMGGKMAPEFKKMVLEVNLTKSFSFTEDYKMVDRWSVYINVRTI